MATKKTRKTKTTRKTRKGARKRTQRRTPARKAPPKRGPRTGYELRDEVVEQAIVTGEHRALLESYFGEEGYEELRTLATRALSTRVRGGPRVLILPGIMGSKLGEPGTVFDDVIWADFADIVSGRLTELSLEDGSSDIEAVGVILLAYLTLKWRLNIAGFDASFHPYDWRQNINELGASLAKRIVEETAASSRRHDVSLVAHSMGGLVCRSAFSALGNQADKIRHLVMLGTPNFGSFSPVAALRGTHSLVRKLVLLDLEHTEEDLNQVFNTFPGLYQMLPWREKFPALDLYDPVNWPKSGPGPRAAILKAAPRVQQTLAPGHERFSLIAGVNRETVTSVRIENDEFVYTTSLEGDGTVPLEFAELDNVQTYYIDKLHGFLPSSRRVGRAVIDILESGTTSVLPQSWERTRVGPLRELSDTELQKEELFEGRVGDEVSASEFRHLLDDFAAPPERAEIIAVPPPTGGVVADVTDQPITVGRRVQHRIDLHLVHGSITEVDARAVLVGVFRGVPPAGAATAIDRQLAGAITEFTDRRMFTGDVGEIFIMPAGRQTIAAEMVLFAGLGAYDQFNDEVLRLVAENVARTLIRTKVDEFATVLLSAGSGSSVRDVLASMVEGFFRGLREADYQRRVRSITLCELDADRYRQMRNEILRLANTPLFDEVEVTVDEWKLPPPPPSPPTVRVAPVEQEPVYLFVREVSSRDPRVREPDEPFTLQASVLTAGSKATVVTAVKDVDTVELDRHLEDIEKRSFNFETLHRFGTELGELVLPPLVSAVLRSIRDRHIVVIHDATAARVPWETLRINGRFLAQQPGVSRKYEAPNLSVAKWLEQRRLDRVLNVLLVVNPTEDLSGAEREGARIVDILGVDVNVEIDQLWRKEASWSAVRAAFRSGKYDVVHYAGHAFFDPVHRGHSGVVCHGAQVLSGADLVNLENLPSLVFFNACEAGRVRGADQRMNGKGTRKRLETNIGLAEAFLRGGVANYVGTYWPVGDEAAEQFASAFYRALCEGKSIGAALGRGRDHVHRLQSVDWADYVHYGSPGFVVKRRDTSAF